MTREGDQVRPKTRVSGSTWSTGSVGCPCLAIVPSRGQEKLFTAQAQRWTDVRGGASGRGGHGRGLGSSGTGQRQTAQVPVSPVASLALCKGNRPEPAPVLSRNTPRWSPLVTGLCEPLCLLEQESH